MRAAVYQDPRGDGIGGGEFVAAVLLAALRRAGHAVDYVHHQRPGLVARVGELFETDLTTVGERPLPRDVGRWDAPDAPAWRRRAALRGWMREASDGYDLFVCVTHGVPPVCHARRGLLYVLFPHTDRRALWPWSARPAGLGRVYAWARQRVYEGWWAERLRSYRVAASISEFVRRWTRAYWGLDTQVVFPPVAVPAGAPAVSKADRVAVVGRFTPVKRQLELVRAFAVGSRRLPGWSLGCVGGLSAEATDRAYFESVAGAAAGAAVELAPNAPAERVRGELARAKVFWHGMGLGATSPMDEEHFGIATVEAMAAGCVPVVPDRGGQPEIVAHGENGFVCTDASEYVERTAALVADPGLASRLSAAARDRAAGFAVPVFLGRMLGLLGLEGRA